MVDNKGNLYLTVEEVDNSLLVVTGMLQVIVAELVSSTGLTTGKNHESGKFSPYSRYHDLALLIRCKIST